jgi:hypothetical protein
MPNPKAKIEITAKDLTKAAFKSVGKSLKTVTGSIFNMKTALVAVAGGAGFGAMIASSLTSIDVLGKTADKIGIATESLGKLQFAASIAGTSSAVLNKALQKMVVDVGEANMGIGQARIAFENLGLAAKDLIDLSPEEQFAKIAGALNDVENNTKRVTAAYEIFGAKGTELLNIIALGEDGIRALGEEAELLGLTMSRDTVAGVEAANDSITRLGGLFKGFSNQFTAALAPAIQIVTDEFKDFLLETAKSEGGIKKFAQTLAIDLLEVIKTTLGAFKALATGIDFAHAALIAFGVASEREGATRADNVQKNIDLLQKFIDKVKERNALPPPEPDEKKKTAKDAFVGPLLDEAALQRTKDTLALKTEALAASLLTEDELLIAAFARRSQIVIDAADRDVITDERKGEILRGLAQKLADDELAIKKKQQKAETALQISGLKMASGILKSLESLVGSSSKKKFEQGKKLAKASVVVDTAAAIMRAFSDLGPIGGAIAAVGIGIAGIAQLANINRTQFGGGGGVSAGGVNFPSPTAGSPPSAIAPNNAAAFQTTPQSAINITIQGNVLGNDEFVTDTLVPILQDAINNNDTVLINGNSAQALELAS